MSNKKILISGILFLLLVLFWGCQNSNPLDPKKPVTLTLWHNYGGQMKDTIADLVDEFNETIGVTKGIIINITSISASESLHEKLTMIAKEDPGAPDLPDITTVNPKTALILAKKDLLVDLNSLFTKEELSAYVPQFIKEGKLETNSLYIFPTAKSTEVLYLNKTLFDRFAKDTNASYDDLKTFEGLAKTAALYYNWSDEQTPDVSHDGKTFYHTDSLFNFTQIGCKQLGVDFVSNEKLDYASTAFKKVWNAFYEPAVKGHYAIFDGYASDLAKTGEIVASTGSTAGVIFFSPTVTYADNTTDAAQLLVLPYPIFENGKKVAVQRGSGMIVTKSNKSKEYAAKIFLKWFTEPKQNMSFVSSTGYLPVTTSAYGEVMNNEIKSVTDKNIKNLLKIAIDMQSDYDLFIPPLCEDIEELESNYETKLQEQASKAHALYQQSLASGTSTQIEPLDSAYEYFIE